MSTTSTAAYSTGWASIVVGISNWGLNEWTMAIGLICTVGTFAVNWYYKRKSYQLMEEQAHPVEGGKQ